VLKGPQRKIKEKIQLEKITHSPVTTKNIEHEGACGRNSEYAGRGGNSLVATNSYKLDAFRR
jgi:hypothetical protein